jgi:hypothetical protein
LADFNFSPPKIKIAPKKKTNEAQGQINDPGTQLNGTSQINDKLRLTKKSNSEKTAKKNTSFVEDAQTRG